MLKLSGWSHLTWGRIPSRGAPEEGGAAGAGPRGLARGVAGTTSGLARGRGAWSHRLSRREPEGPGFSADLAPGGQGRPAARPRPRASAGLAGRGERASGVTPRQVYPRPSGLGCNLRSKTRWFAGFCNSHQVSHFATFFIDARAKISVAESRGRLSLSEAGAEARPPCFAFRLARVAPCVCSSVRPPARRPPFPRRRCRCD